MRPPPCPRRPTARLPRRLFCRLSDEELARLARAPTTAVEGLRQQIEEVGRALGRFADLLPRLTDEELTRLTGATVKTIRFWRLSQPRHLQGDPRRRGTDMASSTSYDGSGTYRGSEDSDVSSSTSTQRRAESAAESSGEIPTPNPTPSPNPGESSTFVIDTVE